MSGSYFDNMRHFSFEHEPEHSAINNMEPYNFAALSPITSERDIFFPRTDKGDHQLQHINPAAMWSDAGDNDYSQDFSLSMADGARRSAGLGKILTEYNGNVHEIFGQITPPDDNNAMEIFLDKRVDSAASNFNESKSASQSTTGSSSKKRKHTGQDSSKRARKPSQESDDEGDTGNEDDSKRGKYREKNRVAAAKCRAKKKDHIDHLEENHRTHSALNVALKQTEKSLRDELSYWRTQALQHSFCGCLSIQQYNLRKAQNLADESILDGRPTARLISPSTMNSHAFSPASTGQVVNGLRAFRSQSVADAKPTLIHNTVDPASGLAAPQSTKRGVVRDHMRNSSESMLGGRSLSNLAEQELKDFVNDVTER